MRKFKQDMIKKKMNARGVQQYSGGM